MAKDFHFQIGNIQQRPGAVHQVQDFGQVRGWLESGRLDSIPHILGHRGARDWERHRNRG